MERKYLCLLIIALLISMVSITVSIIAFWSSCKLEYDSGNALMSAFSIMVTILIGAVTVLIAWQVYNHYVAKDEVRQMVEEETKKLADDIWHVLDSNENSSDDACYIATSDIRDYMQLDAYIRGIEIAKKCHLASLKEYSINYALERFHQLYIESKEKGEMHITKGKRKEYEHLCTGIDHKYIEELRDYIQNAVEVDAKMH